MTVSLASENQPASQASVFHWPLRVYWEDTDAGGIVFYANYLKYFERARTEWLRQCGLEQQALRKQLAGMFVVSECQLRYLQPARLDDRLDISVEVIDCGRVSMLLRQHAYKVGVDQTTELLCSGTVRLAWVQEQTLRPLRLPAAIVQALGLAMTSAPDPDCP